jgi:hypothetical protein
MCKKNMTKYPLFETVDVYKNNILECDCVQIMLFSK